MRGKSTLANKLIMLVITAIIIAGVLVFTESKLKKSGYEPGWYYAGFKTTDTPRILISKQITKITTDSFDVINTVYGDYPLNQQGFICKFNYDSATLNSPKKKKVMIIGDSFTQGALPYYDSSFVARLARAYPDKLFLNFGVSGTDPLNYALILNKYIGLVKPSLVVIAFCGGNDEMNGDNHLPQNQYPIMWYTNFCFGGLETRIPYSAINQNNRHFPSVDSMYRFYYRIYNIKGAHPGLLSDLLSSTRVGTLLRFFPQRPPDLKYSDDEDDKRYCHKYLQQMKALCDANHVKMILAYIPPKNDVTYKISFPYMAADCYYPEMTNEDYNHIPEMDIHWNSQGHKKFALFLGPVIDKYLNE